MRFNRTSLLRLLLLATVQLLGACSMIMGAKPVMPVAQGITFYRVDQSPAPTVILLPGCGGIPRQDGVPVLWQVHWLNDNGFNAVLVDYVRIMGLDSACFGQIKPDDFRKLLHEAITYTASQSFVDRDHIALLGESLGASAALTIAQEMKPDDRPQIAAVAAYYPGCYRGLELSKIPTLLLLGLADDVVNPYACIEMANRSPQTPLVLKTYWGAYHGFDSVELKGKKTRHFLWKTFTAEYDPEAAADARKTLAAFLKKYNRP